jgi:hypothetical protein
MLVAMLPGCAAEDRELPAAAFFAELDSAGVAVLVTPGADALAPLGWELDTVPDLKTGAVRELTSASMVRSFVSEKHGPRGPMGHMVPRLVPFAPAPVWALAPGGLLVSDGGAYEIRELDSQGQLARILRIDATPESVTPEMLEGWVRWERRLPAGSSVDPAHLAEYADHPIPETLPSFRSLVVDAEGWLWAEVYAWDPGEPGRWIVFDPEGRARGSLQTPAGLEVHAITPNRVLGVWRSPLGEEFVHGYGLLRAGAQE